MKLVVGLGNPGKKYAKTRHNAGFMALDSVRDKLAVQTELSPWELSSKFNAQISAGTLDQKKILLVKPMTYMNASGESVQLVAHFYGLTPADIVVVHDDKDLPLGTVRVQKDRSHAGHNGVRSVIEHLGTKDFLRVRIGIASQGHLSAADTAKFVLNKFSLFERTAAQKTVESAAMEIMALFV
ncbi:MAG: Peptidyl-tRNA hydrolase [Candidatus Magasanikbacteria bacterium GW2011_GWA2_56_11]|uniref:Peptidyl-tRNA hydrolase n=1 Tax=Candidatus Magasanikbacteria bacterium GW2011_GWA2_56_11 TaxID=1619044 RepID=A0A0G1YDH5_9BACT|nr:MAG: Peptidyl-tRNA hydrolase [Candidatus Magasanikbacteria bacterium GW2011_GWA2_56_11]